MIQGQPGTQADEILVTFTARASGGDSWASVVGEFNDWSPEINPMERDGEGNFTVTIPLTSGRTYRFRYLFDDGRWENDSEADAYAQNVFGGDDSIADLTSVNSSEDEIHPFQESESVSTRLDV